MIKGWADREARRLFEGKRSRVPTEIQKRSLSKLQTLDAATKLETLAGIPGNRMEVLGGDRLGQHSIRVNVQYRVCFRWESGDAYEVEVVDHHG
ncbi:MAG: type II toxin-antitoxin system RelE/ParE family toxin [Actinomycetota bacterium]|nr:type II toxin-antitoxin system RelE/ParE family toxin [Rubrobacter sp.]MDQ3508040.1 type II toxin-antitoxin system RelE/ParE family toxin [Actinomycetota bacterium]